MISLLLYTIVGLVLFISFVLIAFRGAPKSVPDSSALSAVSQMLTLEGSSFANPQRLLDDTEYQMLLSNPDLRRVARQFRKDRQELALLWMASLVVDLKMLWRFRQFLIRQGVTSPLHEELGILQVFVFSLLLLTLLRASTRIWGPFVFARMTRQARHGVDRMSYATAGVLGRIPPSGWPEIERSWARIAA